MIVLQIDLHYIYSRPLYYCHLVSTVLCFAEKKISFLHCQLNVLLNGSNLVDVGVKRSASKNGKTDCFYGLLLLLLSCVLWTSNCF